jgi:hypothetical protein
MQSMADATTAQAATALDPNMIESVLAATAQWLVASGVPNEEAHAVAIWWRFGSDRDEARQQDDTKARDLERAAQRARDFAFELAVSERVRDSYLGSDGFADACTDFARKSSRLHGLADSIERKLDEPTTYQGQVLVDRDAHVRAMLARARSTHEQGWGSVSVDMWNIAVELMCQSQSLSQKPTERASGRPQAAHLKALCAVAAGAGLTPMQMARAGVAHSAYTRGVVGATPSQAEQRKKTIEDWRARLQRHWPKRRTARNETKNVP